ncbi:hypothetical protein C8R44DRAFT_867351 [Mycena epipterygia]|nr:hypothetical protein C8R44DRAFT_867351 [Mycena epipterygia]
MRTRSGWTTPALAKPKEVLSQSATRSIRGRVLFVDFLSFFLVFEILTLPPEITAQIFFHYVHKTHIGRTETPDRGPLLLASVCSYWRGNGISVGVSAGTPGTLFEWGFQRPAGPPPVLVVACRQPALGSALAGCGPDVGQTILLPDDKIQARQEMVVTIIAEGRDVPVKITAFDVAPRLREVRLSGASLQWISLPWIQLIHLEFLNESLSACVEILKQTPRLEALGVYFSYGNARPPSALLTLLHLHTLNFTYDREGSGLTLPALETLELAYLRNEFCPDY